jgi:hypothetical protein
MGIYVCIPPYTLVIDLLMMSSLLSLAWVDMLKQSSATMKRFAGLRSCGETVWRSNSPTLQRIVTSLANQPAPHKSSHIHIWCREINRSDTTAAVDADENYQQSYFTRDGRITAGEGGKIPTVSKLCAIGVTPTAETPP